MNVHDQKVGKPPSSKDALSSRAGPRDANEETQSETPMVQPRRSLIRRFAQLILPLVVIGFGVATYTYLKQTRPEKTKRPTQERVFSVKTIPAQAETLRPTLKLYGSTVSGRRVDIRALVAGRVTEAGSALKEGGRINSGDMLVRIDPFSYQSAVQESEALLAEAKARVSELEASIKSDTISLKSATKQLALARRDLKRAQPLARRGTVSKRTVDERQQTVLQREQARDQLSNAIKVWKAKIAQQKAIIARLTASLGLAQRRLDETALNAPFNAYVVEVSSQVGRMVGANDKIATLIDRDWIEAKFTLSDEQYGRILSGNQALEGRKIDVVWVLGEKKIVYPATIERVAAEVNAATGGVEVLARVEDPSKPIALRAGAFVEVRIPDKKFVNVFRVPPTALYNGNTVYVIEDGRLAERAIKVVGAIQNDALIEGPITSGVRILATRISTPGSGVRVQDIEQTQ